MSQIKFGAIVVAFTCGLAAISNFGVAAIAQPSQLATKSANATEIMATLARQGFVRVYVEVAVPAPLNQLDVDAAGLAAMKSQAAAAMASVIQEHFDAVAAPREGQGFPRNLVRFDLNPLFSVNVNTAELERLAGDGRVVRIQEERRGSTFLAQSVPLIGMQAIPNATGQGRAVVVIDTGVQANHEFLAGKVVLEACFSNGDPAPGRFSLCPNGRSTGPNQEPGQTGPGAASAVTARCMNGAANMCDHGTHVAGIAAGNNSSPSPSEPPVGVARGARIVALQVFTRSENPTECTKGPPPCVIYNGTDLLAALNWVAQNAIDLSGGIRTDAVNLSLGESRPLSPGSCDTDLRKGIVDVLWRMNVATVAASGNDGWTGEMPPPACISTAISVGSTTKTDEVSCFTNINWSLDLLAPGGFFGGYLAGVRPPCRGGRSAADIRSAVPPGAYADAPGTSQAAPHVAGAFAAIRSIHPNATVEEILKALVVTGLPVADQRPDGRITKPRIRVDRAAQALGLSLRVSPTADFNASGKRRGPFSPSSATYEVTSVGGPVNFAVTKPDWMDVSSSTGQFVTPATIRLDLNQHANQLVPRTYLDSIVFTNTTNGLGNVARKATLTVLPIVQGKLSTYQVNFDVPNVVAIEDSGRRLLVKGCDSSCNWVRSYFMNEGITTPVDSVPDPAWRQTSGEGMTPTGSVTVGWSGFVARPHEAFRQEGVARGLGFAPGDNMSEAHGVSSDGRIVVGDSSGPSGTSAAIWTTSSNAWVRLPRPQGAGTTYSATRISGDGTVAFGRVARPFGPSFADRVLRWSGPNYQTVVELDLLPGFMSNVANAANIDGTVLVGSSANHQNRQAFRWTSNTGMQGLGYLNQQPNASSDALAVSADGRIVHGVSNERAFRWTEKSKMVALDELLIDAGVEASPWRDFQIQAASSDGTWLAGLVRAPDLKQWFFKLHLPLMPE